MTSNATHPTESHRLLPGGRIASDALRRTYALADDFAGLEEGVDRYGLLLLVKKTGKIAGFSPRMIALLDYYLAFTRDSDWEEGNRPIVYQSLSRTALDLGVSERMVQKLEAALFAAGAIGWNDSGNHRRYGQRCPQSGRLLWAFGVDLTPLAYLKPKLEGLLQEKQLHDEAWLAAKRAISACRRQIRATLAEWSAEEGPATDVLAFERRYDEIAVQLRTHIDLAAMRALLARHQTLLSDLLMAMGLEGAVSREPSQRLSMAQETRKGSPPSVRTFAHYKSTTQQLPEESSPRDGGLQGSVADPAALPTAVPNSGLTHVTLGMALGAASERFSAHLPHDPQWPDIVEAAYRLRPLLGVSQASWGEACGVLGRNGAALCLLVTDRATERTENAVEKPAAYFRGMVRKAGGGELRLHNSVFGLLDRL